ncbi:MAG: hypothetical protein V7754_19205 [Halioglobus sp.]
MWELVLLTGLVATGACLFMLVRTEQMLGLVNKVFATRWIYLAAFFRLLLGAAFIASAHTVKFPQVIAALGWLMVFGGLVLVAAPQTLWQGMASWFTRQPLALLRAWLVLGLLFGGALIYIALA